LPRHDRGPLQHGAPEANDLNRLPGDAESTDHRIRKGEMTMLKADRQQLCSFVLALFLYASQGSYVSLRAFRDDADGAWGYEDWSTVKIDGSLDPVVDAAFAFACRCAEAAERVCFAPPIATFNNPNKADAASLADGLVITAELDSNPAAAREKLEAVLGHPTVAMESGGEWIDAASGEVQPKLHLHWRLTQPTRNPIEHDFVRECNRLAAMLVGGDPSAIPAVHPLRWAGSVHRKRTPRLARITELNPEIEITLADALGKLRAAVAQAGTSKIGNGADSGPHQSSEPQADALDIAAALAVIPNDDPSWTDEESWNFWNKVSMATWRASAGSEAGYAALVAWSTKSKRFNAGNTRSRWDHYSSSPPNQIGAGTLFHMAKAARPDFVKPSELAKPQGPGAPPPGFDDPPPIGDPLDDDDHHTSTSWATPAPPAELPWPEVNAEAFYGVAGQITDLISLHSEADPVAILAHILAMVGNAIGRKPHYLVENDRHYLNLFELIVGPTSKGRKGVSANRARQLMEMVDPEWTRRHTRAGGLSTGEGLIWQVRDPIKSMVKTGRGKNVQFEEQVTDEGVKDKRLLIVEGEFARTLSAMERPGNTLSAIMRSAWDGLDLEILTKTMAAKATAPHISVIAHITIDELRRLFAEVNKSNGFGNRFVFLLVKRFQYLPFGGSLDPAALEPFARRIAQAIKNAQMWQRIDFSSAAKPIWEAVYPELSREKPGLTGAATERGEAQVVRLATLYSMLDFRREIFPEHLNAALALWRYAEASAKYVFGDMLGDPTADEVLRALRQVAPDGLTRNEIGELFGRHRSGDRIGAALGLLLTHNKARRTKRPTRGRAAELWFAV
jgi:hypothetical protein